MGEVNILYFSFDFEWDVKKIRQEGYYIEDGVFPSSKKYFCVEADGEEEEWEIIYLLATFVKKGYAIADLEEAQRVVIITDDGLHVPYVLPENFYIENDKVAHRVIFDCIYKENSMRFEPYSSDSLPIEKNPKNMVKISEITLDLFEKDMMKFTKKIINLLRINTNTFKFTREFEKKIIGLEKDLKKLINKWGNFVKKEIYLIHHINSLFYIIDFLVKEKITIWDIIEAIYDVKYFIMSERFKNKTYKMVYKDKILRPEERHNFDTIIFGYDYLDIQEEAMSKKGLKNLFPEIDDYDDETEQTEFYKRFIELV